MKKLIITMLCIIPILALAVNEDYLIIRCPNPSDIKYSPETGKWSATINATHTQQGNPIKKTELQSTPTDNDNIKLTKIIGVGLMGGKTISCDYASATTEMAEKQITLQGINQSMAQVFRHKECSSQFIGYSLNRPAVIICYRY